MANKGESVEQVKSKIKGLEVSPSKSQAASKIYKNSASCGEGMSKKGGRKGGY